MTAFPCKADIKLNLGKRSANDPKRTFTFPSVALYCGPRTSGLYIAL